MKVMFCIFAAAENGNLRNGWKYETKWIFCIFTAAKSMWKFLMLNWQEMIVLFCIFTVAENDDLKNCLIICNESDFLHLLLVVE
jgi:hypothetical protein